VSAKLSMADLLRASQVLSVAYLGVVNGLFRALSSNSLTRKTLAANSNCDERYVARWVDAALSQGLIVEDPSNGLRIEETFASLARTQESEGAAQALQAVFSILVADAIAVDFRTGHQQGYALVDQFTNLSPYFGDITESLYGRAFDEEVWPLLMQQYKSGKKLSVLDYGCGSGWLLRRLNRICPRHILVGAGSSPSAPHALDSLRYVEIGALAQDSAAFDLVIVNKVLHHLGDNIRDTIQALRAKLAPGGALVAWEFSWPPSTGQDDDRSFLNLIEHAQGGGYLDNQALVHTLSSCGFAVQTYGVCGGKEVLYVARSAEGDA
jgi:Methyltransferase domain